MGPRSQTYHFTHIFHICCGSQCFLDDDLSSIVIYNTATTNQFYIQRIRDWEAWAGLNIVTQIN